MVAPKLTLARLAFFACGQVLLPSLISFQKAKALSRHFAFRLPPSKTANSESSLRRSASSGGSGSNGWHKRGISLMRLRMRDSTTACIVLSMVYVGARIVIFGRNYLAILASFRYTEVEVREISHMAVLTPPRPDLVAHREAATVGFRKLVTARRGILGKKLTAYIS